MNQETAQQPAAKPPELTPQDQALLGGIAAGRAQHPDFDTLLPLMDSLARAFFPAGAPPDWAQVSPCDFIEALYVMARHASFSERVRKVLLAQAKPPQEIQ